jgi:predicted oxidoreductase
MPVMVLILLSMLFFITGLTSRQSTKYMTRRKEETVPAMDEAEIYGNGRNEMKPTQRDE